VAGKGSRVSADPAAAEAARHLRRLRERHNLLLEDVAARIGTGFTAVSDFERRGGSRKLGSIQAHAHGIGYRTVFGVEGLPDVDAPAADQLRAVAAKATDWRRGHAYERAALGALLRAHREHQGLTQSDLAGRLGKTKSTVGFVENLDQDLTTRTVGGHVEGLGGKLGIRFVLADDAAVAARVVELMNELAEYAIVAPRWKVDTAGGPIKGIPRADALRIAEQYGGTVSRSTVYRMPTGHEVLGPWLPYQTETPTAMEGN
jgi:transcriptional regulator with XRE-family HTH domain